MSVSGHIRRLVKDISLRTGVYTQTFFDVYPYMFTPQQLIFMCQCLKESAMISGCCLEAGCAYGATTVFLNKFMKDESIDKQYFAIDTFSGFPEEHSNFEIKQRNKRKKIKNSFSENKQSWFNYSLQRSGIGGNVHSIAGDVTKFDYSSLGPISFCLLDVDLYLPVKDSLPKIYHQLSPGGIMIIDDCKPNCDWDGAYLAYQEFCHNFGIKEEIHHEKIGVLRKI